VREQDFRHSRRRDFDADTYHPQPRSFGTRPRFSRTPSVARDKIVALAARYKLPAIYNWREFAADGGLMAYGDSLSTLYRRAGDYAGRILKGAKPRDLPIDRPAVIQLVVNLTTAKALGLTLPPAILGRADEVIE
jgi:putative tryptophan/tyrosine transport system substrate-binding protein